MRCVLLLAALGGCATAVADPPPGRDLYYSLPSPLEARLLHLRADGVFRLFVRTLPMTKEALRGTWRVTGEQSAALRCEQWSHMVVLPPVRIRFGNEWARQVPHVRSSIAGYLAEHALRQEFSEAEMEDVGTWETVVGGEAATVIPISLDGGKASRAQLEAALPLLDAYAAAGDPREVKIRLHRHKDVEFLEWLDWSGFVEPRTLEQIRTSIDTLGKDEELKDVWVRLTPEEFQRELGGDGFRYRR